jgi:hypothetical protein
MKAEVGSVVVAGLRSGESASIPVTPGLRAFQARLQNTSSTPLTVEVRMDGEPVLIEISSASP